MLNVTTNFKNAIKQSTVISSGKVDIVNSLGTLNFTSSEISKIEVYGTAFNNDKVFGNLAQHSLTLELLGDLTKSISLQYENVCKAYIGIDVNGSFEYVQFQDFVITSITYSDTQNITRIIATDNIVKLNKEFIDDNTYPMTLKSYLESVLNFCDLELENTEFINDDYVVESQPFVDYTSASYIVGKVAELSLSFVTVNKVSNKIELKKAFDPFTRGYTHQELSAYTHEQLSAYTHFDLMHAIALDDEQVYKSNYWSFKLSDNWFGTYGVNTLTLGISQVEGENNSVQDDTYVDVDGNIEIIINDNEFINTEVKRLSVINDMFTEVLNYKYSPYTLDYRGFPYLEIGDIVQITNMDNGLFNSPIYEMIIRYDGGLYGQLKAKALSKAETQYLNTNTLSNRVKNAEIKVDKVNGEITLIASEVSDLDSQVSSLTLDVGSIELSVSSLQGDVSTLDGQVSSLTLDVDGLELVVGDYEDGKLEGAKYTFDGTNATFYGGGLKIKNNANTDVFYADIDGNLILTGTINANNGEIAGWIIGENTITSSDGDITLNSEGIGFSYIKVGEVIFRVIDSMGISHLGIDGFNDDSITFVDTNLTVRGSLTSINSQNINLGFNESGYQYFSPLNNGKVNIGEFDKRFRRAVMQNLYIEMGGFLYQITRDSNGFLKATTIINSLD